MGMENQFVIDNNEYSLGKDIDGVEHTVKELQDKILIKILLEIDRVCRKNNIPYALAYGSAMGLVNYGTFTPWDDDGDVAIDYFDIPRFVEACEKDMSPDFVLEGWENNKKYNVLIPTFKVRYINSYQKEANWFWLPNRCGNGNGFFVDVVAFMGVPETDKEHKKVLRRTKWSFIPYNALDALLRIHPYAMKKSLKKYEQKIAEKYRDSKMVSQTVIIPWQDMTSFVEHNSFPREVIYPFREFDFAGHKLFSFNDPEKFVELRYGKKVMKYQKDGVWVDPIPEKSKRVWHTRKYSFNKIK